MQGSGKLMSKDGPSRNSLVVQWLGLRASTAEGRGLIPGWGTKIPQAAWCGQKKKKKKMGPECLLDCKGCSFASVLEGSWRDRASGGPWQDWAGV